MSGTLHALCIGIDNYEDPGFRPMQFARRDALALHALLTDNSNGDCVLVQDAEATKARLVRELRRLAEVSTDDDVVFISFSGHGTRTRELATYDAIPGYFADTALPLAEFVSLVRAIKARLLVVVLDCCFSGGMLARAFYEHGDDGGAARSDDIGAWDVLKSISGDGRIFLGAASPDEEAFEVPRYRHGILTHHLIRGLMGDGDVLDDRGRVCLMSLVRYVQTKVSAEEIGTRKHRQHPTFEGSMRKPSFPPLQPRARYLAIGDHAQPPPVNKDLMSLVPHGIDETIAKLWRSRVRKLNDVQVAAINAGGLLHGCNVLVSAPTASGKTLVGEIAALHMLDGNRKAVFLLPTRALVSEQYKRFQETYGPLGHRVVRATGGLREQVRDLVSGSFEIAVVTYETFIGLYSAHPTLLDRVGVLVIDEIQNLLLPDRGPRLELLLTRLRKATQQGQPVPQLVGLSAVLGDQQALAGWLGAYPVPLEERTIALSEGVIGPNGSYRHRVHGGGQQVKEAVQHLVAASAEVSRDQLAERLVATLVAQGERVLVFRARRAGTSGFARQLARQLGLSQAKSSLTALPQGDESRVGLLLRDCLNNGVAFHNADLLDAEQEAVVQGFGDRAGDVRVVVATTTLSQGVNLFADSVVICELDHPDRPYTPDEYQNMAGRAGRDQPGRAFVVCAGEAETKRVWRDYVNAEPQPARSALVGPDLDLDAVVLAVLNVLEHEERGADAAGVADFLRWSFAAFHERWDDAGNPFSFDRVRVAIEALREEGFLASDACGCRLTPLGETVVRSGLPVSSARALVATFREVVAEDLTKMTLIGAAQLVTEADDGRFAKRSTNWQREYDRFAGELVRQRCSPAVAGALLGPRSEKRARTGRTRRAIACLMWSAGQPIAEIETALSLYLRPEAGIRDPGPIAYAAQRTADIIQPVIDIARHLHPESNLGELAENLPWQLSAGVAKGLAPVARHLNRTVERAMYLRLGRDRLTDATAIAAAELEQLLHCTGGDEPLAAALRAAAEAALEEANQPALDDLIAPPED
ncbi:DEAD/DEAH box helicase [Lentzea aerocolonigenes]|uniref:DEAD/DEAH box helicase n=1 Tax=Lentzea aerocolonigenes TaxID=68170 RepID=UPI000AE76055|nr:DEAD/DEAH box helicase [Lentzea aerocolonigenes]MCP2241324.1 Replicative superfamily II helicase [Lentzea aerocolonigenes]